MPRKRSAAVDVAYRLRLFCTVVEAAVSRRAVQNNTLQSWWKVSGGIDKAVTFEADLGDEEDIRSLLLDIRKLLASGEVVHFPAIANLLETRLTDDDLRADARVNRESWKRSLKGGFGLVLNGTGYDAEAMFNLLANGAIFHSDPDKVAEYERLDEMTRGMMAATVNQMIIDCVRVAQAQRNLVTKALADGSIRLL
jgi:hypothetical protein